MFLSLCDGLLFYFIVFHFISVQFISFHFISFHFISFHFISFHFISFHFISFHFISFLFISFHFISFYFILLYNHCVCNSGAYMLTCAVVIIILPFLYRAFCDKFNKARVDHLFSLLFEKALATPPGANEKDCVNKLTDLLPGVQWLNLPLTMEVNII